MVDRRTQPTRKLCSLCKMLLLAGGLLLALMAGLHRLQPSYAQGPITITKLLNRLSDVVRVGEQISFTVALTNNSSFTLTHVTLVDRYDQTTLALAGAGPGYDEHDPAAGIITWTNVASPQILPGQSLSFTLYFNAHRCDKRV